jgi:hypothetical protein
MFLMLIWASRFYAYAGGGGLIWCWRIKLCDTNFNLCRHKIPSIVAPKIHDTFFHHQMEYVSNRTNVMYTIGTLANNIAAFWRCMSYVYRNNTFCSKAWLLIWAYVVRLMLCTIMTACNDVSYMVKAYLTIWALLYAQILVAARLWHCSNTFIHGILGTFRSATEE